MGQLKAELAGYAENRDTSKVTDLQTNQGEIINEISDLLEQDKDGRGIFEAVKTLFSKKDIIWTDQLNKIAVRLVRLYELQREGTTSVLEFSTAKDELRKRQDKLIEYYKGGDAQKAIFILKNVENSRAGTTQLNLEDLEQTRNMVQAALRDKMVAEYQVGQNPQRLEGPHGNLQRIKKDVDPEIITYLRLFESLSIAIIRQQEITREKQYGLDLKKEEVLDSLDSLSRCQGINISPQTRERLMDHMSIMSLGQLEFFQHMISALLRRYTGKEGEKVKPEDANAEIAGWLDRKFDKAELHADLEAKKEQNRKAEEKAKEDLRAGRPVHEGIQTPVDDPITPWTGKKRPNLNYKTNLNEYF